MNRWLRLNALSLTMFGAFLMFLTLQSIAGWAARRATTRSRRCAANPFLAVGALVVLSIFLRQRGSSQSKPVAAPHAETGG